MIIYNRLWETLKIKGITQYDLYTRYHISRSLLDRLRKNKNVEIYTLDYLCTILDCKIEEIVEHVPDNEHER
ncbi:MAG: helix-turn-helix transcriptional regulator [Blautia sp.]|nr:helix-turn-helix transcriptional regulator [Blautia sp.]